MIFIFDDSKEPEDIFAETSSKDAAGAPPANLPTPGPGPLQPATGASAPQDPSKGTTPLPVGESGVILEKSAFSKKLVFGAVVVGIILIGLGVWYFVFYDRGASLQVNSQDFSDTAGTTSGEVPLPPLPDGTIPPSPTGGDEPASTEPPADVPADTTQETVEPSPAPEDTTIQDMDSDGLTDAEERAYGTDPTKADTDGDGLSDREEVRTYGTDPLNPDTDGDGFDDGSEVRNGYDPNGPGRLLQIPQ